MEEKLTTEQARVVKLPAFWYPLKRFAQLEEYGEALGIYRVQDGILPAVLTRSDLVYYADHNDQPASIDITVEANSAAANADN
jgi:hypothetical protein